MEPSDQIKNNGADRMMEGNDSQTHLRFLEDLDRINRAMQGTNDLEQMMRDVLTVVLSILDCDRVWLLYPCDPDALSFRVPMEVTKPEYPGAKILNVDVPMSFDTAQNMQEALGSNNPVTYAAGTERPINKVTAEQFGVQSQMFIAIHPKLGKPWAFGVHQCSYARIWTIEEKNLFQEIGRRLADSLSSLLLYRNLQESKEQLAKSVLEMSNLMNTIPQVLYVLDTESNIIKWNKKAEEVTGYSAEELARKLVFELLPENERPIMIAAINDAYEKKYVEVKAHLKRKDGTLISYRWSGAPVRDEKQNDVGIIGIGWDLTEQTKNEENLQLYQLQQRIVLDTVPDVIWMKDVNGIYLAANKAFLARVGKLREDVIGKTDFDFWPKEYAEKYRADDNEVIVSRSQKRIVETAIDAKGAITQVETIKTPAYDDEGALLGVTGVARDITNRTEK